MHYIHLNLRIFQLSAWKFTQKRQTNKPLIFTAFHFYHPKLFPNLSSEQLGLLVNSSCIPWHVAFGHTVRRILNWMKLKLGSVF